MFFFRKKIVDRRQRRKLPDPAFFLQANSMQAFTSVLRIEVAPHALACVPHYFVRQSEIAFEDGGLA